jgi:hypothetical protein
VLGESCEDESNFSMQIFLETGYHCTSMHPPPSLFSSAHAILIRLKELVGFHVSIFVAFHFSLFAFRFSLFTFCFSFFAFRFSLFAFRVSTSGFLLFSIVFYCFRFSIFDFRLSATLHEVKRIFPSCSDM